MKKHKYINLYKEFQQNLFSSVNYLKKHFLYNFLVFFSRSIFFIYAYFWQIKKGKIEYSSMNDILNLFYFDFLRIEKKYVEIVKISHKELVTRCRNPCPILKIANYFNLDTRDFCKRVSEPVCKYVLRKIDKNILFERNYNHIRPYKDSCEEKIELISN